MNDLDELILIQFSQLMCEARQFTTALVADELSKKEQEDFAKRFVLLAESLQERAERTRRREERDQR